MIIAGIDLSLTRSGFVILDKSSKKILHQEFLNTKEMRGMQRILFIKKRILQKLEQFKVSEVILEGYSFGSKGRSIVSLGELGGVIRVALFENNYKYIDCSPNSLKAYTTGKGNADKDQMRQAVLIKYGIDFEDDNVCDAFSLAMMLIELGTETEQICSEGGAATIRKRRLDKLSKKINDPLYFRSLLRFGLAKKRDYEKAKIAFIKNNQKMKIWDFLGIEQLEYENLEKKSSETLKFLNKKYEQDLLLELV